MLANPRALQVAVMRRSFEMCSRLLEEPLLELMETSDDGDDFGAPAVLMNALFHGTEEIVRLLFRSGKVDHNACEAIRRVYDESKNKGG